MQVVIAVVPLDRLRESPEKTELIVRGEKKVGHINATMMPYGAHAILSMEIPKRRPQGRVLVPEAYKQ